MQLEKEDLIVLNRTGESLKRALYHLVKEFPRSAQTITGMSSWLNFNSSNCQRILNGINKSKDGKHVLCLLPGIAGLQDFLIKVEKRSLEKQLILEAEQAVEAFDIQLNN